MSHGVHAVQHEVEHHLEHEKAHGEGSGGHGGGHDSQNKRIALVISVLALFLAFSETLGKSAQTNALNFQIEASNLWNFFQAKNIRRTSILVAADTAKIELSAVPDGPRKDALVKQLDAWTRTAERYRSEPEADHGRGEGTKELSERAVAMAAKRDVELSKYHYFEFASAALQIGIVLASAAVITGMIVLVWLAGGLGVLGLFFMGMALFAPHIHLFGGAAH